MRLDLALASATITVASAGTVAAFPWLTDVGGVRMAARAGGRGATESSTLTVALDNAGGQASRVVGVPLRRLATVYDEAGAVFFRGTVQRVTVGRTLALTLEAGGASRLLSEDLPLRTTRMLGDFARDVPLPHRFGDLTAARFPLIRLTDTEWLAADHPMEIAEVFVDDERTLAWEADLLRDDAGHAAQIIRFAAPVASSAEASATGRGVLSPTTGALLENPADLMEYVLALAGIDGIFPELRAQASADDLRLAGSVDEVRSVRSWLDEIARSAGALWTPDAAVLYPGTSGPVIDLPAAIAGGLDDPVADVEDTADVLRVAYNRADATGRHQGHVELTAAPVLFGGVVAEVSLPWVRLAANAETIGRRLLERMAAQRYEVAFTTERHDLRPGQRVRLVDNPEWLVAGAADPVVMVTAVDIEANAGATRVSGEALLSTPTVEVTAHSLALPDTTEGGVDVAFRDGIATFTVKDDDGRPLAGARVTLDGGAPRTTDARGAVSFATTEGQHELLVEIAGFATQRIEFEL